MSTVTPITVKKLILAEGWPSQQVSISQAFMVEWLYGRHAWVCSITFNGLSEQNNNDSLVCRAKMKLFGQKSRYSVWWTTGTAHQPADAICTVCEAGLWEKPWLEQWPTACRQKTRDYKSDWQASQFKNKIAWAGLQTVLLIRSFFMEMKTSFKMNKVKDMMKGSSTFVNEGL